MFSCYIFVLFAVQTISPNSNNDAAVTELIAAIWNAKKRSYRVKQPQSDDRTSVYTTLRAEGSQNTHTNMKVKGTTIEYETHFY